MGSLRKKIGFAKKVYLTYPMQLGLLGRTSAEPITPGPSGRDRLLGAVAQWQLRLCFFLAFYSWKKNTETKRFYGGGCKLEPRQKRKFFNYLAWSLARARGFQEKMNNTSRYLQNNIYWSLMLWIISTLCILLCTLIKLKITKTNWTIHLYNKFTFTHLSTIVQHKLRNQREISTGRTLWKQLTEHLAEKKWSKKGNEMNKKSPKTRRPISHAPKPGFGKSKFWNKKLCLKRLNHSNFLFKTQDLSHNSLAFVSI